MTLLSQSGRARTLRAGSFGGCPLGILNEPHLAGMDIVGSDHFLDETVIPMQGSVGAALAYDCSAPSFVERSVADIR